MNNLLEMKHVAVNFAAYGGTVQAVRDISFSIEEGQTVALVGESGCGKSITAKTIMGACKKAGESKEEARSYLKVQISQNILLRSGKNSVAKNVL